MQLEAEKVGKVLRCMQFRKNSHIKYISFKQSMKSDRIGRVLLNWYLKVKFKCKCLEKIKI